MKFRRLNLVGDATPSIEKSVAWYSEWMGAEVVQVKQLESPWKKHDNIAL